jgi:hypothetical protein
VSGLLNSRKFRLVAAAGCALAVVMTAMVTAAVVGSAGPRPDGARPEATVEAGRNGPGMPDGSDDPSLRRPGSPPVGAAPWTDIPVSDAPPGGTTDPMPVSASQAIHGNSVTMHCRGAVAELVAAHPADGWALTRMNPGPAEQVGARFESTSLPPYQVTFQGRCEGGTPRLSVS